MKATFYRKVSTKPAAFPHLNWLTDTYIILPPHPAHPTPMSLPTHHPSQSSPDTQSHSTPKHYVPCSSCSSYTQAHPRLSRLVPTHTVSHFTRKHRRPSTVRLGATRKPIHPLEAHRSLAFPTHAVNGVVPGSAFLWGDLFLGCACCVRVITVI